jgi:hypothetical protein
MVADSTSVRMRPEWQEWHVVSPGKGRQWPNVSPHAAKVAALAFRQRRRVRRCRKLPRSACGQSGRSVF